MSRPNLKIGEKYEVSWVDCFYEVGWWGDEAIENRAIAKNPIVKTCGYLAFVDEEWLVVSLHSLPSSLASWGQPSWIPQSAIKEIKELCLK